MVCVHQKYTKFKSVKLVKSWYKQKVSILYLGIEAFIFFCINLELVINDPIIVDKVLFMCLSVNNNLGNTAVIWF